MKFSVGIDFGTYQTKVCIHNIERNSYEFLFFPATKSPFLPSTVTLIEDRFEYGHDHGFERGELYSYFKMKSALDDDFIYETSAEGDSVLQLYRDHLAHEEITPDVLSVLFVSYVFFIVQERVEKEQKGSKKNFFGGLIREFVKQPKEEKLEVNYTIGMPTEWTAAKQIRRRQKFSSILLLSRLLYERFENQVEFERSPVDSLLRELENCYAQVRDFKQDEVEQLMTEKRLRVMAENAAGITALVRSGQLTSGTYSAVDIGGGSTDVSFFNVTPDQKIRYIASESYAVASNNIYEELKQLSNTKDSIEEIQSRFMNIVEGGKNPSVIEEQALRSVEGKIEKLHKRLFVRRVKSFHPNIMNQISGKRTILYGGGSLFPILNDGTLVIFDNGATGLNITIHKMNKAILSDFNFTHLNIEDQNVVSSSMNLLFVALGLSMVTPEDGNSWFEESDYHSTDETDDQLIPHPVNKDCYILNPFRDS